MKRRELIAGRAEPDIVANALTFDEDGGVERDAPNSAPTAFRIWKYGLHTTDKGNGVFNETSAAKLIAAQALRGNLYSIDVDHLSLNQDSPPESRKAVGWHRLDVRLDAAGKPELWAVDVQWTDVVRGGLEKDPPEWRYFSPAYNVDPETREVLAYLNTALTNNPATWQVTALASIAASGNGASHMKMSDIAAALRAMAEGDGDDARTAKALCAMLDDGSEKKDEPEKKEASEGSDEKKDEPEKKEASEGSDEKKDDGKEEKVAANVIELAKIVHELKTERAIERITAKRETLLASRPDFSKEVRATLAKADLNTVENAVKTWPRVGGTGEAGTVKDARAALEVKATQGSEQVTGVSRLPADQKTDLDRRMGLLTANIGIKKDGNRMVFGAPVTPETEFKPAESKTAGKAGSNV